MMQSSTIRSMTDTLQEFAEIRAGLIESNPIDAVTRRKHAIRLEELLFKRPYTPEEVEAMTAVFADSLPQLHQQIFNYSVEIEKDFCEAARAKRAFDPEICKRSPLFNYVVELARNEARMARLTADDKVLFIGSGPFPLSAILYVLETDCSVVCMEKDKENADVSRQLLQDIGLSDRITVLNMSGEEFADDGYTLISVPSQALPKDALCTQIAAQASSGTNVIFRVRGPLGALWCYESELDERVFDTFVKADETYLPNRVIVSLLTKRK